MQYLENPSYLLCDRTYISFTRPLLRISRMDGLSSLAVAGGAAAGALLRWVLEVTLNPVFPLTPLGTLVANLVGGFLMGIALHFLAIFHQVSPRVRLVVTTGFLGGLTTFSTFSAEVVDLLGRGFYDLSFLLIGAHVGGSIILTILGLVIARLVMRGGET